MSNNIGGGHLFSYSYGTVTSTWFHNSESVREAVNSGEYHGTAEEALAHFIYKLQCRIDDLEEKVAKL